LALDFLEVQLSKVIRELDAKKFIYLDIEEHKPHLLAADVLFLDIEMPNTNGLELAEKIIEVNPNIEIVFVTAYNEYAVQAFEVNALDYLLKPVKTERLAKTLARLDENNDSKKSLSEQRQLRINVCGELTFEAENKTLE